MGQSPNIASDIGLEAAPQRFTLRQRFRLWVITWAGYLALYLLGPTIRFRVGAEETDPALGEYHRAIYPFWHNCVFAATWFYRNRGLAVMASRSFDGEYIARIVSRLGYIPVRGSSSRGGARALLESHRILAEGHAVAFTIDGPRGPRYVAKPGPVLLARNTGMPIVPFYIALEHPWVLPSWDGFMLPKPFSRALVRFGKPITVPPDADDAALDRYHAEMQATLDRVRDWAVANLRAEHRGVS